MAVMTASYCVMLYGYLMNCSCTCNRGPIEPTSESCVKINVEQPVVTTEPKLLALRTGSSAEFHCRVLGTGPLDIMWLRSDGSSLPSKAVVNSEYTLTIPNVGTRDQGGFKCTAKNAAGEDSDVSSLTVEESVITVTIDGPRIQTIQEGSLVRFVCTASGLNPRSAFTLKWTKEGGRSTLRSLEGTNTGTRRSQVLTIRNIRPQDAGTYVCSGSNGGDDVMDTAVLRVQPKFSVKIEPRYIRAKSGEDIEFRCIATGSPTPSVEWLAPLPNKATATNGVLSIPSVTLSDQGDYKCLAKSGSKTLQMRTILYVEQDLVTSCGRNQFMCANRYKCIDSSKKCDQREDCSDGSDERDCESFAYVRPSFLTVTEGVAATLVCGVEGRIAKTITWTRAGSSRLPEGSTVSNGRLTVPNIQLQDGGNYVCTVETSVGLRQEVTARIAVERRPTQRPTSTVIPASLKISQGATGTLVCTATGYPAPEIEWKFRGGQLRDNHRVSQNTLQIVQASPADSGAYQCVAMNTGGAYTSTGVITVSSTATKPTVSVSPKSVPIRQQSRTSLRCTVRGKPTPRVSWLFSGGALRPNHLRFGTTLQIRRPTRLDKGTYTCVAENSAGTSRDSAVLTVPASRPSVSVQPQRLSLKKGDDGILRCSVNGSPVPERRWTFNGGSLRSNHEVDGDILRILQASASDQGTYVCIATNNLGTVTDSSPVTVTTPIIPRVVTVPAGPVTNIGPGDKRTILCRVTAGSPQPDLMWTRKDGKAFGPNTVATGGLLKFNSITEQDTGVYVCKATNQAGVSSAEIQIGGIVSTGPKSSDVTAQETSDVTLECRASGFPTPTLRWEGPSGQRLLPGSGDIANAPGYAKYTIRRIRLRDAGRYTCVSENLSGEIRKYVNVNVIEKQGKVPVVSPITDSTLNKGSTIRVTCVAFGDPQPSIRWSRQGKPFSSNVQVDGSTLFITNIQQTDAGVYVCSATNSEGSSEEEMKLTVRDPPEVSIRPSSSVTKEPGSRLTLTCTAKGTPPVNIEWTKIGQLFGPYTLDRDGVLEISNVRESDAGQYQCTARNEAGYSQEYATVNVVGQLTGMRIVGHETPKRPGERVTLMCSVAGGTQPTFRWERIGAPLPFGAIRNAGRLTFTNFNPTTDAGTYRCIASNDGGEIELTARVKGSDAPINARLQPLRPPSSGVYTEGSTAIFRCSAEGGRIDKIEWKKQNGVLPAGRYKVNSNILTIKNLTGTDSASYSCVASNDDGRATSAPYRLRVKTSIKIIRPDGKPGGGIYNPGENVVLQCGDRRGDSIRWIRQGGALPTGRYSIRNGALTIFNARSSDSGTYICTYSGPDVDITGSVVVTVEATVIPSISPTGLPTTAYIDQRAVLVCEATGSPKPRISWKRLDGKALPSRHRVSGKSLIIRKARKQDSGQYVCIATNRGGSSQRTQELKVTDRPPGVVAINAVDGKTSYRLGDTMRLQCSVAGSPGATIKWEKQGGGVLRDGVTDDGGLLTIRQLNEEDKGTYVCVVENSGGRSRATFQLDISVVPPTIIGPKTLNRNVFIDQRVELICNVQGFPAPTITWRRAGGRPLPRGHIASGNSLVIPKATQQDEGTYICTSTNSGGSATANRQLIITARPPGQVTITAVGGKTSFTLGDTLSLQCSVTGTSDANIRWEKEGGAFQRDRVTDRNGLLTIQRLQEDDIGRYVCHAENSGGRSRATFELNIVVRPPTIPDNGSPNLNKNVFVNQRVTFTCNAVGFPTPTITWKRAGGRPLPASHSISGNTLVIPRVQLRDDGTYICVATNSGGTSQSRRQLIVRNRPPGVVTINALDGKTSYKFGDTMSLQCSVSGSRDNTIRWIKEDGFLPRGRHTDVNGLLTVERLEEDDGGSYVCMVENAGGSARAKFNLRIAQVPPTIINGGAASLKQNVFVGQRATLSCDAQGYPPPTIRWLRADGGSLPVGSSQTSNSLVISSAQLRDSGTYVCVASNSVGRYEVRRQLQVRARQLGNVVINAIGGTSYQIGGRMMLQCSVPDSTDYTTRWTKTGGILPIGRFTDRNGILTVSNLQQGDAGNYACIAENSGGNTASASFTLFMDVLPSIIRRGRSDRIVSVNQGVEFVCAVAGSPTPEVTWTKIGGQLPRDISITRGGTTLFIRRAQLADAGTYVCTAKSRAGQVTGTRTLQVTEKPSIDQPGVFSTMHGRSAELQCTSYGKPPIQYSWRKLNDEMPSGFTTERGELKWLNAKTAHEGTYVCTATNEFGTASAEFKFLVGRLIPHFKQAPESYMALANLPFGENMDVEISFYPEKDTGLLLFNGDREYPDDDNFVTFGIDNGYPEFRYDLGSGEVEIRSSRRLDLNKWHNVKLSRNGGYGTMTIDGSRYDGRSPGISTNYRLDGDSNYLYLGSMENVQDLPRRIGVSDGFEGAVSQLLIDGKQMDFVDDVQIVTAPGEFQTCTDNRCQEGAVCLPYYTQIGYKCVCRTGFGDNCNPRG